MPEHISVNIDSKISSRSFVIVTTSFEVRCVTASLSRVIERSARFVRTKDGLVLMIARIKVRFTVPSRLTLLLTKLFRSVK